MGAALVIGVKDLMQQLGPGGGYADESTPDPWCLGQGSQKILVK
jgi:hypothetical protein